LEKKKDEIDLMSVGDEEEKLLTGQYKASGWPLGFLFFCYVDPCDEIHRVAAVRLKYPEKATPDSHVIIHVIDILLVGP
jgi:hypothetical protein